MERILLDCLDACGYFHCFQRAAVFEHILSEFLEICRQGYFGKLCAIDEQSRRAVERGNAVRHNKAFKRAAISENGVAHFRQPAVFFKRDGRKRRTALEEEIGHGCHTSGQAYAFKRAPPEHSRVVVGRSAACRRGCVEG